ncbi:MAG TPA: PepSY domain-containing protein [Pseudolabrys sp.]|nr:PepSY domain-containing protein [Pseudolabrys sp.]
MTLGRIFRKSTLAAAVFAMMSGAVAARDQDDAHRDEIRRAVEAGEIHPLADILKAVREKLPGEVARVKVENKGGHWQYEFRVVDNQGRLFEVYVNAQSAEIERVKEK